MPCPAPPLTAFPPNTPHPSGAAVARCSPVTGPRGAVLPGRQRFSLPRSNMSSSRKGKQTRYLCGTPVHWLRQYPTPQRAVESNQTEPTPQSSVTARREMVSRPEGAARAAVVRPVEAGTRRSPVVPGGTGWCSEPRSVAAATHHQPSCASTLSSPQGRERAAPEAVHSCKIKHLQAVAGSDTWRFTKIKPAERERERHMGLLCHNSTSGLTQLTRKRGRGQKAEYPDYL